MTHLELRQKFFDFWKQPPRNHVQIPSSSLVPENDPTTLFTGSGMQPMMPYLLGAVHPLGTRLVDIQKCFRGQDINEVGNNRHDSFFEMFGNWSLGDYFKKEQIAWVFEFLTKNLELPKNKLHFTVFEGDGNFPKDDETIVLYKNLGVEESHIHFYGPKKNWWSRAGTPAEMPVGEPGGPDSEIFFEFTQVEHDKKYGGRCHPNCDCGRFVEIGNSVFMTYLKTASGFVPLEKKNIDFGGGLERTLAAKNNEPDIFKTDIFLPIIKQLEDRLEVKYGSNDESTKSLRIIADHLKAAVFLIADGVVPSNKLQGYVLRRLLRRSASRTFEIKKSFDSKDFDALVHTIVSVYPDYFDDVKEQEIESQVSLEIRKFRSTIERGYKEIERHQNITGKIAFDLYQTYGFPVELTEELADKRGQVINKKEFQEEFKKHQDLSRNTSAKLFKGGLADHSEIVTKYHTATHLLQAALRQVLGTGVHQEGSNLTAERLRFDFSHGAKLTAEEIKQVEAVVNEQIKKDLQRKVETMTYDEAVKKKALAFFKERYPEKVTVYSFDDFSREICGGPHVEHTGVLGKFKITREEAVSAGIRRIYAVLE